MNLLLDRSCLGMMNVRRLLWPALGMACVITIALMVLMFMVITMEKITFSAGRTCYFKLILSMVWALQRESLWLMLDYFSTLGGLFQSMFESKCIASFICFGVALILSGYFLHLTLRFIGYNKKRVTRRRRGRSCL